MVLQEAEFKSQLHVGKVFGSKFKRKRLRKNKFILVENVTGIYILYVWFTIANLCSEINLVVKTNVLRKLLEFKIRK